MGESDSAAEVAERIRALSRDWANAARTLRATAGQLIFENSTLSYYYLAAIRSEGEAAAQRRIAADIERLIRQRPELAREFEHAITE